MIITGNDAKNFILKRENQIKNINKMTDTNKRLKLINDYKSVKKLMKNKL